MDIEKIYDALALIIGERENVEIKFKIERKNGGSGINGVQMR